MNLELVALQWLMNSGCFLVMTEQSPRCQECGIPDALGITQGRRLVEIEVKRSLSDFRADFKKRHRQDQWRQTFMKWLPWKIYYLVPGKMLEGARKLTPEWAGLMYILDYQVVVDKRAPANKESQKLSLKECVKFSQCLCRAMLAAKHRAEKYAQSWRDGYDPIPPYTGESIYQI